MIEFIFGILSMVIAGFSILLMKKGMNSTTVQDSTNPFLSVKLFLRLFKNKYWFCGGVLLIFSWGFRIIATSIADLSYVRMLYVPHLLIVVVGSYWFLKEQIPRSVVISSMMMVAGLVFLALSPPLTRNPQASLILLYFFILILTLASLGFFLLSLKLKKSRNFFFSICAAFFFGNGVIAQGFFSSYLLDMNLVFDPRYYALLLAQPVIYFIFIFSLLGFVFTNMAMYKSQVSIIYPIVYPLSEIMILVGSVVIFQDDISIISNFWRVIGIICIFSGFIILVFKNYRNLSSFMHAGSISGMQS